MYQPREYRQYTKSDDLVSFKVTVDETDLFISADKNLSKEAESAIKEARRDIQGYIKKTPLFKDSLEPLEADKTSPDIIKHMADAAMACNVGPMASVAGAVAEYVGKRLLKFSSQVIVENGGDIFLASKRPRLIGLFAGKSKFSEKVAFEILPEITPCGVCTSSATVGHSLSLGKADAVVIISPSTSLSDACATAVCNRVKAKDDIDSSIEYAKEIEGIKGIFIVMGDTFGAWGSIKLVDI